MNRVTWNDAMVALTLVHLGQQLGTDGPTARAVFEIGNVITSFLSAFLR